MFYKKLLALIACFTLSATTYAPAKSSAARKASIAAAAIGGLSATGLGIYLYLLNSYLANAKTSTEKRAILNSIKRIHTLLGISSGAFFIGAAGTWLTHNEASTTTNNFVVPNPQHRINWQENRLSPTSTKLITTLYEKRTKDINTNTVASTGSSLNIPIASPYSIYSALGMLLLNAQGNSAEEQEILVALNASSREEAINIINDPKKAYDEKVDLNIFNAAILTTERDQQCGEALRSQLGVETEQINGRTPEEITDHVNDLCKKHTKGMIPKIISSVMPNSNVLLNALYLKAQWQTPFDEENTRAAPFTSHDGSQKSIQMMHRNGLYLNCSRDEEGNIYADIPYESQATSSADQLYLSIYLPIKAENLYKASFKNINALTYQATNLHFPRCSIATPATDITSIIETLGVSRATLGKLGFNGVMHAAVMECDEQGTKAAAATAVILKGISEAPIEINVNKPFAFSLRNKYTEFFTGVITSADDFAS